MPSPIETIATRVLAVHELVADWRPHPDGYQRLRSKCTGCEWEVAVDGRHGDAHVAHQAAEIARAIAEDEGLREVVRKAVVRAELQFLGDPTIPHHSRHHADAVIAALTTNPGSA